MDKIPEYRCSDLALASFLKYSGLSVKEIRRVSDYKAEFIFEEVDRELINKYHTGKAIVDPKKFAIVMKRQHIAAKNVLS